MNIKRAASIGLKIANGTGLTDKLMSSDLVGRVTNGINIQGITPGNIGSMISTSDGNINKLVNNMDKDIMSGIPNINSELNSDPDLQEMIQQTGISEKDINIDISDLNNMDVNEILNSKAQEANNISDIEIQNVNNLINEEISKMNIQDKGQDVITSSINKGQLDMKKISTYKEEIISQIKADANEKMSAYQQQSMNRINDLSNINYME